jgi:hypothetical protein
MFDDYTTTQLIALRHLCGDIVERAASAQEAADVLLILEYIDEELTMREHSKSA